MASREASTRWAQRLPPNGHGRTTPRDDLAQDHYRIQFDRPKHGVQLVRDVLVMPLLDGSRGIHFTSPHGLGLAEGACGPTWDGGESVNAEGGEAARGEAVHADPKELQLIAYVLRLLERKRLLMVELKNICAEAERELRRLGQHILAAVDAGTMRLHCSRAELRPPPVRVEVTAAQQRVLGQVPTPPEMPSLGGLLAQLRVTNAEETPKLERRIARHILAPA